MKRAEKKLHFQQRNPLASRGNIRNTNLRSMIISSSLLALSIGAHANSEVVNEPLEAMSTSDTQALVKYMHDFWSTDRIASATAMMMVDTGEDYGALTSNLDDMASNMMSDDQKNDTGAMEVTAGGEPESDTDDHHKNFYPDEWDKLKIDWGEYYKQFNLDDLSSIGDINAATGADTNADTNADATADAKTDTMVGTQNVYIYYDVNTSSTLQYMYPHRWMGKFTFTTPNGNSSCSATAISRNHVLTAAHCVYDTGRNRWYSNKAFHPAYRNGAKPYGTFATTGCTILRAWIDKSGSYSISTWARHDVAVCNVGRNTAGRTLNQSVGWAGRSWNYGYNQLHFNSGYPARNYRDQYLPYPAQYLRSCTAESFYHAADTLGSGCYYGRGISGGSLLRNYKVNVITGHANSVNSGIYIGSPNLYGARFSSNNIVPICNATGC